MRRMRLAAWTAAAAMVGGTLLAILAPWPVVAGLAGLGFALRRRGHLGLLLFAVGSFLVDAFLFGLLDPGPGWRIGILAAGDLGTLHLGEQGILTGLRASLRLIAIAAVNLAAMDRIGAERLLDGLGLPPAATALLGAVALAAVHVGRDARGLVLAARLDGRWPKGILARVRATATLFGPLLVSALRRAETRRDALRLAGMDVPPSWAPIVAMSAIAIAGRLAFLALPNVAFTYLMTFLAGVLFGPFVGAATGIIAMGFTDLVLTGLSPAPIGNVPGMAVLGACGGWARRLGWGVAAPTWVDRSLAAFIGVAATMAFSVVSDVVTWLILPEARATPGALPALVALGLVFNTVPAIFNALLFAAAVPSAARAWRLATQSQG